MVFVSEVKKINKSRIAIALPLLAIVVAAGFAMVAGDKVFAQPSVQTNTSSQTVDQPDQPDSQDSQSTNADNHSDGETNDDNSASSQGSTGDGDGEHQD